MTRLPMEGRNVHGHDGEKYTLNSFCAVAGCPADQLERHHIWRRSFLIGDFWWVALDDGVVVGNCVGLCNKHHREVTENRCQLLYEDGLFYWSDPVLGRRTKLDWQPPFQGDVQVETHVVERQDCPTCLRPMPKPKIEGKPEVKRVRKTWAVSVPNDELEDGADVLDGLIDAAREELDRKGLSYGSGAKYYILATSMALFVQHAGELL